LCHRGTSRIELTARSALVTLHWSLLMTGKDFAAKVAPVL
jgi:hypothetical protein